MGKTFQVALREFKATVMTRAFLLAVVLPPALMTIMFALMPILMNQAAPKVAGRIAVLDKSGAVTDRLRDAFSTESIAARRTKKVQRELDKMGQQMPLGDAAARAQQAAEMTAARTQISLEPLGPETDLDKAKAEIAKADGKGSSESGGNPRLALAVIPADAVRLPAGGAGSSYAGFELFVAPKLDIEVQGDIEDQISRAIVDARIEASSLDVKRVRGLVERPKANTMTVTAEGEHKTSEVAALLVPGAFLFLLWISVFTAGQYLLTSTIEEKSNRVMEVLLSAVSPMQLMVGKIFGQMAVGTVILVVYAGVGMAGLVLASMVHLIDPMNLVYLAIYFLIAFFLVAAMMAAVGSAVSDVREAQSLIGPVMIVLVIPMMLWMPILRNPNSVFAQVCSFLPPISPFIMVLRLAGSEPVPFWQIPATILIGIVYAIIAAWGAAKIFRIGVLMYGKPPNFATLIKWVRMA